MEFNFHALAEIGQGFRLLPRHLALFLCGGVLPGLSRERSVKHGKQNFRVSWTVHEKKSVLAIREARRW